LIGLTATKGLLMQPARWMFAVALVVSTVGAEVRIVEDDPVVGRPRRGRVSGRITPAGMVLEISALSRATGAKYAPASFNKTSGAFAFHNLPGDAAYDICIRTVDGRSIEGIDLRFVDQRFLDLAAARRKQLHLPAEQPRKFTRSDAEQLLEFVEKLKDFMEIRRVLYVRGHGARATVLVELMRDRAFHSSAGDELIWRVELWYFRYEAGGWRRLANQERVLRRRRIDRQSWRKISLEYYPQLSAYVAADGTSQPVEFELPPGPDPSRGRAPNSQVRIRTTPHILGVDGAATSPKPASLPGE